MVISIHISITETDAPVTFSTTPQGFASEQFLKSQYVNDV